MNDEGSVPDVPCGGRKKSPRTSSIVQIILLRSVRIFRVLKVVGLEPSSNFYQFKPI